MSQCWAMGAWGRCESDGGHEGNHLISYYWSDEECILPGVPVPVVRLPAYADTPIHTATLVDTAVATSQARCFSCGCTEPDHLMVGGDGEPMCERHQCRTFIA